MIIVLGSAVTQPGCVAHAVHADTENPLCLAS